MEKQDYLNLADIIYGLLSPPLSKDKLEKAYSLGMIAKKDLIDGSWYLGSCRNASKAIWDGNLNLFKYERYKFGDSFEEEIEHPEDDIGSDIFVPTFKIENEVINEKG